MDGCSGRGGIICIGAEVFRYGYEASTGSFGILRLSCGPLDTRLVLIVLIERYLDLESPAGGVASCNLEEFGGGFPEEDPMLRVCLSEGLSLSICRRPWEIFGEELSEIAWVFGISAVERDRDEPF